MPTTSKKLDDAIEAKVEAFVEDLTELVRQQALESVRDALGGSMGSPQGGRRRSAPKKAGRPRAGGGKGQKRSPEELEQLTEALYEEIAKQPGRRIEQIAPQLNASTRELALPVKKLIADGWIRTKGTRRATTYFAKK